MNNKINDSQKPYVLIISGPTASGKTDLSLQLSTYFEIEIINVDVGQFYKPLSIGTAKPDWQKQKVVHHCFDLINEPKDLSAFEFSKIILKKINDIWSRKKIPVLVGGSLFYIKSLFFPPKDLPKFFNSETENNFDSKIWDQLNKIDPKRAKELHKNDIYRIQRALDIWKKTGIKPSEYKPKFEANFNSRIIFINYDRDKLKEKINKRTELMIKTGWIEETKKIMGTNWQKFLSIKKLIGYPEIIQWVEDGEKVEKLKDLIEKIQIKTHQYAKRQITFWKSLKKDLSGSFPLLIKYSELKNISQKSILQLRKDIQNDLDYLYYK